jgi:hypothetical protein
LPHFIKSKTIQDKLYQATTEITNQYTLKNSEIKYWEKWLYKVFSNPQQLTEETGIRPLFVGFYVYNTTTIKN